MRQLKRLRNRILNACLRRGLDQQFAFQSFVTSGVTALSGIGILLLLSNIPSLTIQLEILSLLAMLLVAGGILGASLSYLLLLLLRLSYPANTSEKQSP